MDNIKRIPVRVIQPDGRRAPPGDPKAGPARQEESQPLELQSAEQVPMSAAAGSAAAEPAAAEVLLAGSMPDEVQEWRDRALRLQAEMDNYRKRQQRLAQDQIGAERERMLKGFLRVVDNLERALEAPVGDGEGLRHGIELTHRTAVQFLEGEGVERIEAEDRAFDPDWHEAVATVSHNGSNAARNSVVRVLEPGYRLEGRLLRPARVIVAV
jgi:molecular chaperone GrpE